MPGSGPVLDDRRLATSSARDYSTLVPEYGKAIAWERPRDHVVRVPSVSAVAVESPRAVTAGSEPRGRGRFGRGLFVLALALAIGIVWPVQFVLVALLLGGGFLIDDALRDAVPSHAPKLRRAQRPVPWLLAAGGIAASFVWPQFSAQIVLGLLALAAVVYLSSEALASVRALRQHPPGRARDRRSAVGTRAPRLDRPQGTPRPDRAIGRDAHAHHVPRARARVARAGGHQVARAPRRAWQR